MKIDDILDEYKIIIKKCLIDSNEMNHENIYEEMHLKALERERIVWIYRKKKKKRFR